MSGLINLTHASHFPFFAALFAALLFLFIATKVYGHPQTIIVVLLTAAVPVIGYAMKAILGIRVIANVKMHVNLAICGSMTWQIIMGATLGIITGVYVSYFTGLRKKEIKSEEVDDFEEYPE